MLFLPFFSYLVLLVVQVGLLVCFLLEDFPDHLRPFRSHVPGSLTWRLYLTVAPDTQDSVRPPDCELPQGRVNLSPTTVPGALAHRLAQIRHPVNVSGEEGLVDDLAGPVHVS